MNNINEVINIFKKINDEIKKNTESIYKKVFNLSNDSRLRQVEVNTMNAKIDDTLNFVCNKIYRKNSKNRKSLKTINKDKLMLLDDMYNSSNDIISEIKNEIFMIYMNMFKLYENYANMDIDDLHLINDKLKKILIQLKQDLKEIFSAEDLLD